MTTHLASNADQEQIRSVARRFLEAQSPSLRVRELMAQPDGFDPKVWDEIGELGWPGIALREDQGGVGFGFVERCVLMEEMGRALLPAPYLSSAVLAADALTAAASPAALELLHEVAAGSLRASLVAAGDLGSEAAVAGSVAAREEGGGCVLDGDGGLALDGGSAEILLVAASLGHATALLRVDPADGAAVLREPERLVDDTRKFASIVFRGAAGTRLDEGDDFTAALEDVLLRGAVSLAAEMIGGAQRCLELTLDYVKDRQQFGVAIGSFQALKHRLADLHVMIDTAREIVYAAADVADSGEVRDFALIAPAAKAAANTAFRRVAEETIQLHGGIGFTWEHDAHLFYKRALVASEHLGSTNAHLDRVASGLGI